MAKVNDLSRSEFPIQVIEEHREMLEGLILPIVTTRKTGEVIVFKGKRRYLKPIETVADREWQWIISNAVIAHDVLYQIEREVKKGDVDEVIRSAIAYGVRSVQLTMPIPDIADVLSSALRRRSASAKGGKATTKWTPAVDRIAREIFREVKRAKLCEDATYRRTATRLKSEHGIKLSKDTVKRHLSKPVAQR
jgi:hypothetical protein